MVHVSCFPILFFRLYLIFMQVKKIVLYLLVRVYVLFIIRAHTHYRVYTKACISGTIYRIVKGISEDTRFWVYTPSSEHNFRVKMWPHSALYIARKASSWFFTKLGSCNKKNCGLNSPCNCHRRWIWYSKEANSSCGSEFISLSEIINIIWLFMFCVPSVLWRQYKGPWDNDELDKSNQQINIYCTKENNSGDGYHNPIHP